MMVYACKVHLKCNTAKLTAKLSKSVTKTKSLGNSFHSKIEYGRINVL